MGTDFNKSIGARIAEARRAKKNEPSRDSAKARDKYTETI